MTIEKRADELTEGDVIIEMWTESGDPEEVPLPIRSVEKNGNVVDVVFQNGTWFPYEAHEQVTVRE